MNPAKLKLLPSLVIALIALAAFAGPAQAARLHTTITGGPRGTTSDSTPTFTFVANKRKASFRCSVDRGPFVACSSPYTTPELADGRHTFSVKAVRRGGSERRPAVRRFTVQSTGSAGDPVGDVDPPEVEPDDGSTGDPSGFLLKL